MTVIVSSPDATILAFDTSVAVCTAAIYANGEVVAKVHESMNRGQAERLMPMIENLRQQAELQYEDFDVIATTIGPGSFTGIRVGLAAARGLSLVTNMSVIPLTTTEAIAATAFANIEAGQFIVAIDARREQLYVQSFQKVSAGLEIVAAPRLLNLDELDREIDNTPCQIIGSGRHLLAAHWRNAVALDGVPELSNAAGFVKHASQQMERAVVAASVRPLYLRAPDAKLPAEK